MLIGLTACSTVLYPGGYRVEVSGGDSAASQDSGIADSGLSTDTGDTAPEDSATLRVDADGDMYATPESGGGDCDDTDPWVHPLAYDTCGGEDRDCDGVNPDCRDGVRSVEDAAVTITAQQRRSGLAGRALRMLDLNQEGAPVLFTDGHHEVENVGAFVVYAVSPLPIHGRADWQGTALTFDLGDGEASRQPSPESGDITGDGFPELLIAEEAGHKISVYDGPGWCTGSDLEEHFAVRDDGPGTLEISSGVAVGDANADGQDDLFAALWAGAVVFDGPIGANTSISASARLVFEDPDWGTYAAPRTMVVGDLTGDGMDDVAVSTGDENDDDTTNVYVVDGSLSGSIGVDAADAVLHKSADDAFAQAGFALATGDANGDGQMDLAVGAPGWYSPESPDRDGGIFIFSGPVGNAATYATANAEIRGTTKGLGRALIMGNTDGDPFADLLAGASADDETGYPSGAAYLIHGPFTGSVDIEDTPDWRKFIGDDSGAELGASIDLGDADGDGLDDIVLGAPGSNLGGRDAGTIYLFYSGMGW